MVGIRPEDRRRLPFVFYNEEENIEEYKNESSMLRSERIPVHMKIHPRD